MTSDINNYHCGTPSIEDRNQRWKSSQTDPEVSNEEFDRVCDELSLRLSGAGRVGFRDGCDFYFRGDNYGDRTQYLEIVRPTSLTFQLISTLQEWLREPRFRQWRIMIITYVSDAATIMVYPNAVRVGKEYGDDIPAALERIVQEMIRMEQEKKAREAAEKKETT